MEIRRDRSAMLAASFRSRIRELLEAGKTVREMSAITGKSELHCSRIAAQERGALPPPPADGEAQDSMNVGGG